MAENLESPDAGIEAAGIAADPAAIGLAMGSASRNKADRFLEEQTALAMDQRHHLHEQFKHLHLSVWEKRLGVLLRFATAFVGIAVAASITFLVWDAWHSNNLLIEPFTVPPDLAARGLTGQVVASRLLDRLVAMQAQTSSQRAPRTFVNSWDERGIKLEIPESGVSFSELDQFMRDKLGRDVHVTGDVVRTGTGLLLTARAGVSGSDSVSGDETDLDALVQRLSESVYRLTQPYRFGVYLETHDRLAEAIPILEYLGRSGPDEDRPWAFTALGNTVGDQKGVTAALAVQRRALALKPDFASAALNIARMENDQSLPEQTARDDERIAGTLTTGKQETIRADVIQALREERHAESIQQFGAFRDAANEYAHAIQHNIPGRFGLSAELARAATGAHDLAAARLALAEPMEDSGLALGLAAVYKIWARMMIDQEAEDWTAILTEAGAVKPLLLRYPGLPTFISTTVAPVLAHAEAELGDFASAERRIASTPPDCYRCLIARACIAELRKQYDRADYWFARAVNDAPSIPIAYSDWGGALLKRGQSDGAIEKFKTANQKGPRFADPLEGWGEALMAKNQSHLALAKFAEAEKYAPNWGRLHLKWGEALAYAGRKDKAKAHFARAAQLDLTPRDKAELDHMRATHDS
jgi:tetratricopeptide (TPR) repeat protein